MTAPESGRSTVSVGLVQHPCGPEREVNLQRTLEGVADVAQQGAELVLLQELHTGHYPCYEAHPRHFDQAEPIPGPSSERLAAAAAEHGVVIVGSLFEQRGVGLYHNTAVVFDADGRLAGRYRKMHIPDDPGYYEKFYFTPGDGLFTPIETRVGRLGVLVCWDQWFPEAARLMALAGAEILLYPTAIGFDLGEPPEEQARQREAWEIVQRGHAIANGLPLAACNRTGTEHGTRFWGRSFICGPQGEPLVCAGDQAQNVVATIDRRRSEEVRRMWPFLRDRRIDAYGDLTCRFRDASADSLGHYFLKP